MKPHKKDEKTDPIFEQVHKANEDADRNPNEIRYHSRPRQEWI